MEEKDRPELYVCVCVVNIDKIWREERISSTTAINMKEQFLLLSIKQNKSADCVRRSLCVCVALYVGLSLSVNSSVRQSRIRLSHLFNKGQVKFQVETRKARAS